MSVKTHCGLLFNHRVEFYRTQKIYKGYIHLILKRLSIIEVHLNIHQLDGPDCFTLSSWTKFFHFHSASGTGWYTSFADPREESYCTRPQSNFFHFHEVFGKNYDKKWFLSQILICHWSAHFFRFTPSVSFRFILWQ